MKKRIIIIIVLFLILVAGAVIIFTPVRYKVLVPLAERDAKDFMFSEEGLRKHLTEYYKLPNKWVETTMNKVETDWNQNAVNRAVFYSNNFSYSTDKISSILQNTLFFTEEQAQYGVDNSDIDWNANALALSRYLVKNFHIDTVKLNEWLIKLELFTEEQAKAATDAYLVEAAEEMKNNQKQSKAEIALASAEFIAKNDFSSKAGLYQAMLDDNYSEQEAAYIVNKVNIDWNENATKMAKKYSDSLVVSDKELQEILIYVCGFTSAEALYGIEHMVK